METLTTKRRTPSLGTPPSVPTNLSVIDTPLPSASITNKGASASMSLYHNCRSVLDRLAAIGGMAMFLDLDPFVSAQLNPSTSTSSTSSLAEPTTLTAISGNPLSKLWSICRRGTPLCILFNALHPELPLKVADRDPNLNQLNICKASVYHFLVACRKQLDFAEEDVFTITDLYQDDTNGFVKVVNTINKILHLLEQRGVISVRCRNRNSDPNSPKDIRGKIVMEMLETERKYVQDLEVLQNYMRELQNQKVLSLDTIHYLFGNLNALVDFQRRFLIQVEDMAEKPAKEQRIGLLFVQMEEAFAVYEPYCANYYSAQDLVMQEAPKLQKLANILNPVYELPSMLIKPIQRICKYPLLMAELTKTTDKAWPYATEIEHGLEAIKRVAEKVNETQRKHENDQVVEDLKKRIDDGPNSIETYGTLLLQDKLTVTTKDTAREMCLFLFEKYLLICKENKDAAKNRLVKSNTIIKKKRRESLQECAKICASSIVAVHNHSHSGTWVLTIEYRKSEINVFTLVLRNEENLKLWDTTLDKMKNASSNAVFHNHAINPHLYPMPSPSDSTYFRGDVDEGDESFDDDIDETTHPTRSRSTSISAQIFNMPGRPRAEVKSRQYQHQMPGMNLSPLPRTSASTNSNSSHCEYGFYPVSPPPSHPSSPTSSSRISTGSSNGGWPYDSRLVARCTPSGISTPSDELLIPPVVNRTQSQSAAASLGITRAIPHNTRLRSQSSPNIHKAANMSYNATSHSHDTAFVCPIASTSHPSEGNQDVKVKLSYDDKIYVIKVSEHVSFAQLMEKVERKIRNGAGLGDKDFFRLKYLDEDSDLITINSDDDVQMAFENRGRSPSVSLFVNV